MHAYAALLGRQPALSKAELTAVLPDLAPHAMVGEFFLFETKTEIDQDFLNRLGGTILIAKKIAPGAASLADLPPVLAAELKTTGKKPVFGVRPVGFASSETKDLLRHCKDHLRKIGMPSRYMGSDYEPAKPIQLHDEGLLNPLVGCELTVINAKTGVWVGRTIAAQDVKAYTLKDIGKPIRDLSVGLLPPKLAQILLNFGEMLVAGNQQTSKPVNPKLTVLDPFCGTGVIPIESLLRGHDVLGSDIALKAVHSCSKNIEWARKTYKIAKKDVDCEIWKQDACKPFTLKNKPDVIVTEGTLGPPLRNRSTVKDAELMAKKVDELVCTFLSNTTATLPGVPVVMTLPVWYAQKRMILLTKLWERLDEIGYRAILPPHTDPSMPGRLSLLYRRPDQFVGREIILLQSK